MDKGPGASCSLGARQEEADARQEATLKSLHLPLIWSRDVSIMSYYIFYIIYIIVIVIVIVIIIKYCISIYFLYY